jgi:hypothetical protein
MKAIKESAENFEEEPLKEYVWRLKIGYDEYLAIADNQVNTKLFLDYLKHCLKRNEVINLSVRGRTRSGKSLTSLAIALIVSEFTGISFNPEKHVKFSWQDYMDELQRENVPMHSIYVIDEKEEVLGLGSYADSLSMINVQRICAKKCIHTISLVGDLSVVNVNSTYNLVTRRRNFETFETRLILFNVENQEEIPICSIIVPIKKVLCETVLHKERNLNGVIVSGCVMCDKYLDDKLCPPTTFLKRYEKAKDTNIERIMKGGTPSAKQRLREEVAEKLLKDARYFGAHSKEEMGVMANAMLPKMTNRQFTVDEVDEIVIISRIMRREMLEKVNPPETLKGNLQKFPKKLPQKTPDDGKNKTLNSFEKPKGKNVKERSSD